MRIYFASDVHGSNRCWLKFLAAARFYEADAIVMGGDITGKVVVPIIREDDGTTWATFLGIRRQPKDQAELDRLVKQIDDTGYYSVEMTAAEYAEHAADPAKVEALFRRLVLERVQRWIELAEERLADQPTRCIVNAGNDDFFEIDELLDASDRIEHPEGRVVELDGLELFAIGFANETPWQCPRDIPEAELRARIDAAAAQVNDMERALFTIHVPPFDTELDKAPKLDEELRVVMTPMGQPEIVSVGSTAVREAILEYQPLMGLHGHIHESPRVAKLGRTTVLNPGSEYGEGVLRGALIDCDRKRGVKNTLLVTG
jgi:uncharacterized protein